MSRRTLYVVWYSFAVVVLLAVGEARGDGAAPPEGFRALFNGKDLAGWYGMNPHSVANLKSDEKTAALAKQRAEFAGHWKVENGELVNDGEGPYATTEQEFGDIELRIEYKTVAKADSGIYLRGLPQVQIWDWNQVFDPKNPTRRPHLGSGGLFNNTPGVAGRDPLVRADRPFGEWNQFRIRQIGDRTWVWLNDQLVVDNAVMENYEDRAKPIPAKGPILLQTHGGEIRWRNIHVREIGEEEGKRLLSETAAAVRAGLAKSLTMHASFDTGFDAGHSRGDKACYVAKGGQLAPATGSDDVRLVSDGGRFGGALHFTKKSDIRPLFKGEGVLGYNASRWSASVSTWMRLTPDEDLQPGYCDPVQITGDDSKKGFIFLEWSKDETPRFFRYAIRPLFPIWNPDNVQWGDIPFAKRPMVQVERAPFSRDTWTHVVFTLENINDSASKRTGKLYLNGKLLGTIDNWDLTFGWTPESVRLVLGAAYVGHLDDLAVCDRARTDEDVRVLYALPQGVSELR